MVTDQSNPRTAGLSVLAGGDQDVRLRRLSPPRFRSRPGETLRWIRLALTDTQQEALRKAASDAGASVDALLSVTLEFLLAMETIESALGGRAAAREALRRASERSPVQLAGLSEWRAWQASLSGGEVTGSDELPEVVVSERLLARCGRRIDIEGTLAAVGDWPLAKACERAAAGRGQTLEAFALQAALEDAVVEES
jgi:hypothetical protein